MLSRRGHDIARLSIDTLPADDVRHTFGEAGVSTESLHVLPFASGVTTAEIIEFHRRRHAAAPETEVAITCVSAVHDVLEPELPTLRLAPLAASVRIALRHLLLTVNSSVPVEC